MAIKLLPNTFGNVSSETKHSQKERAAYFKSAYSERLYITDAAQSGLDFASTVSCWGWVYLEDNTNHAGIVDKYEGYGLGGYSLNLISGTPRMYVSSNVDSASVASSYGQLNAREWYFLCGWYDGDNICISINNGTVDKYAYSISIHNGASDFQLGLLLSVYFIDGLIRCAGVSGSALEPGDIQHLYNGGTPLHYEEISKPNLKSKIAGYWNCSEHSDGTGAVTRVDSVGSNDLTDDNTVLGVDPVINRVQNYASFVSANSERLYISDGDQSGLNFTPHVTVWAWVYLDTTSGNRAFVAKYDGNGGYMIVSEGGTPRMYVRKNSSVWKAAAGPGLSAGQWHFICGWFTGSATKIAIDDGTVYSTSGSFNLGVGAADFEIGAYNNGASYKFDGRVRCAGVSGSAITDAERAYLYNGGTPRMYEDIDSTTLRAKIAGYWDLNEESSGGSAVTRVDSTGNNNLTDVNTCPSGVISSASPTPAPYDAKSAVYGSRSALHKLKMGAQQRALIKGESTEVTHLVLTRADIFANGKTQGELDIVYFDDAYIADSTVQAENLDLIGINGQDAVETVAQTSTEFGVFYKPENANQELLHGPLYFSSAFTFDKEPSTKVKMSKLPLSGSNKARPIHGHQWYETEHQITMSWPNVSQAKIAAFKALPLEWPMFIYDDTGDIFQHKLEHVIISEPYQIDRVGKNEFNITITFARLKHYE